MLRRERETQCVAERPEQLEIGFAAVDTVTVSHVDALRAERQPLAPAR